MTYITKLNSFDEVAAWYAKTPVLKSKNHPAEQDVRPIGSRGRKWERIIKIDENTYVFSCGGATDPVFTWGWGSSSHLAQYPLRPQDIAALSPIVWRRHEDGTDTVTIRNGQGEHMHSHIYSFLTRVLPAELWFRINKQGQQGVYNRSEGKEYYLPKTRTVPRHVHASWTQDAAKNSDWAKSRLNNSVLDPDGLELTFRRKPDGMFELLGTAPKMMVKRKRVDVMGKKQFKPHIDEFYKWAMAMYPLMRGQLTWDFRRTVEAEAEETAKTLKLQGYNKGRNQLLSHCEPTLIREVLADMQHPLRYHLGVAAMFAVDAEDSDLTYKRGWNYKDLSDEDFEKMRASKLRATYTRWINQIAGFAKTIREEK